MHAPTGTGETPTNTAGKQDHPRRLGATGEGCGILPPRENKNPRRRTQMPICARRAGDRACQLRADATLLLCEYSRQNAYERLTAEARIEIPPGHLLPDQMRIGNCTSWASIPGTSMQATLPPPDTG